MALDTNECIKRLYEMLNARTKAGVVKTWQINRECEALGTAIGTMIEVQKLVQAGVVEQVVVLAK